ncbi:MAG: hypothetical protein ABFS02_10655 [Pseudomonadota bacterium]
MKRMYYLTPNLDSTEQISKDLHEEGITDWNFHVHSKDEAGLYKRHIHSANYIHKLDIVRYGERGAVLGFLISLGAVAYVMTAQPFGPDGGGALAYVAICGFLTLFGAWVGGLAGLTHENQKIAMFHDEVERGKYLLLIDVRTDEEEKVKTLMMRKHPEAELKRIGSTFINPFKFSTKVAV